MANFGETGQLDPPNLALKKSIRRCHRHFSHKRGAMWVSTSGMASRKSDESAAVGFMEIKLVSGKKRQHANRQGCSRIEKSVTRLTS
jgi:hypothetical protein